MQVVINTQKAIYALLSSNLEQEVFDYVPEIALLPYVTIGDVLLNHNPVMGKSVYELNIAIKAYDVAKGRKNLMEIGAEIFALLNNKILAVEDFTHHETKLLSQNIQLTDEGRKYALEANYKVVIS